MEGLFATLPFDSVDEICFVYHSYETSLAELFHGASYLPCEQSPSIFLDKSMANRSDSASRVLVI